MAFVASSNPRSASSATALLWWLEFNHISSKVELVAVTRRLDLLGLLLAVLHGVLLQDPLVLSLGLGLGHVSLLVVNDELLLLPILFGLSQHFDLHGLLIDDSRAEV